MANILKTGDKFNELEFIEMSVERSNDNHLKGIFLCDCGKNKEVIISRVVNGYTKTCGHRKGIGITHGKRNTKEYSTWSSVKNRVFNKNNKDYPKYSKLGMDEDLAENFLAFLDEIGERPDGKNSIDRIDNTKGYIKGNIRWATHKEQHLNKTDSVIVNIKGETFNSFTEAAEKFDVSITTIKRWCDGSVDKRDLHLPYKGILKPKKNCYYELRYKKEQTRD